MEKNVKNYFTRIFFEPKIFLFSALYIEDMKKHSPVQLIYCVLDLLDRCAGIRS